MKIRRTLVLLFTVAFAIRSRSALSQQVETSAGLLEFVGLHRWTVGMVQDSMARHAPGRALGQCAGVLRSLGFPSALSLGTVSEDGRPMTLVIVVEPQDSLLVRRLPKPSRSGIRPRTWDEGYRILRESNGGFQTGTQSFGIYATGDTLRERLVMSLRPRDSAAVRSLWRFFDINRNAVAAKMARRVLLGDSTFEDRILAAAILGAQRGRTEAWYALIKGLRDEDERVAATSEQALKSLSTGVVSSIDWRPARSDLRALIGGTNVFALSTTLSALTRTKINPNLARALLRNNGVLVFDLLASHSTEPQQAAHDFLTLAAGKDLGMSRDVWIRWLDSGGAR